MCKFIGVIFIVAIRAQHWTNEKQIAINGMKKKSHISSLEWTILINGIFKIYIYLKREGKEEKWNEKKTHNFQQFGCICAARVHNQPPVI